MPPKDRQELRVVIGENGHAFAPSWKIWVHGDSVYLMARSLSIIKLSLHPEVWLAAWTKESGHIFEDTGSRASHKWKPPPGEFIPGYVLGATVATFRLGGEAEHPPFLDLDTRRVEWIEIPDLGGSVVFQVWLSEQDEPPSTRNQNRPLRPSVQAA